jgi:hypothetical protein
MPAVRQRTLDEALQIIGSDPAVGPRALPVGDLSAAVFCLGCDDLDTNHPEWQQLVADVCGETGYLDEALAHGWDVTVTGFVDSTGPMGPGTLNDQLQESRARVASEQLIPACSIPPDRIHIAKGGVGGDGPSARKVTVSYTR